MYKNYNFFFLRNMRCPDRFSVFFSVAPQMSKLTKELKKENTFLKSKCEKSDYTLVELIEEVTLCLYCLLPWICFL